MFWLDYYWHKILRRPYTLAKRIDKGQGQPVVFLHGIASTGENWREVANMLDETKYRVIVLDLLGFGDSPRPDWLQYSVEDHAKAVLASLRKMRVRRQVILVGHSMGSLVAAHIAEKHPKKVNHLILYQVPIYASAPHVRSKTKDLRRHAYLAAFRYLAEHPKMTLWYAKLLGRTASKVAGFMLDEHTWEPFERSLRNTIMQQESFRNIRNLQMPTDIIYGRYDLFVVRKNLQHYFRKTDYLRFYEIDELHRVSKRSNKLLYELIIQDPKGNRTITSEHARLVDMDKIKTLEKKPMRIQSKRKTYALAASAAALLSLVMTSLAWNGNLPGWEKSWFVALNSWDAPGFFKIIAHMSSDIVWVAVIAVALALLVRKYFWSAYRIAVPAVLTFATVFIAEHIIGRLRPNELIPNETVARAVQDGMGFPSGHVATMTAIILVMWPLLGKPVRLLAVFLLVMVGWSRIYFGVHFPLDIVAGVTYAVAVFCVLRLLPDKLQEKFKLK